MRNIPAAHSESHALYGLDPTQLAQLALRDATRALPLQPRQPKTFLTQVVYLAAVLIARQAKRGRLLGSLALGLGAGQPAVVWAVQGKALLLLERYSEAETALLDGLALDPSHTALQAALQRVSDQCASIRRSSSQRMAGLRCVTHPFPQMLKQLDSQIAWRLLTAFGTAKHLQSKSLLLACSQLSVDHSAHWMEAVLELRGAALTPGQKPSW